MKQQQKGIEAQNSAKPGDTKVVVDPRDWREDTCVIQNNGQMIPLNKSSKAGGVKKVELEPGKFIYQDQDGNTIDPKKIVDAEDGTERATKIETLKDKAGQARRSSREGKQEARPRLVALEDEQR